MKYIIVACCSLLMTCTKPVEAAVILSPTASVQNTLGHVGGSFLSSAFNQFGLSSAFTSGVTDFDEYIEGSPVHEFGDEFEWFAPFGITSGDIVWDLGDIYAIDRVAVWNEEATGVENLKIFTSNNMEVAPGTLVGDFILANNPLGEFYAAEVLNLVPTNAQYVRFQIESAYPDEQRQGAIVPTASLGEIAFSVSPVPEPCFPWSLGVVLCGLALRRKVGSAR